MGNLGEYGWLGDNDSVWASAGSIALVSGLDPEAALQIVAPNEPDRPADGIYYRFDWPNHLAPVVASQKPGWTLLVQSDGHILTDKVLVPSLSHEGTMVAFTENVNADCGFVLAREGTVTRAFDPWDEQRGGLGFGGLAVGPPMPEESDPRLAPADNPLRRAHQLIELLTGIRLTKDDLAATDGLTYRLAPIFRGYS